MPVLMVIPKAQAEIRPDIQGCVGTAVDCSGDIKPFILLFSGPSFIPASYLCFYLTRALLAPALTHGDTHPLYTSPSIQCRGGSIPAPMTCFPLTNPCTCYPAPHGPGCAFFEGRVDQHAVLERLRSGSNGERLSRTGVLYSKLREQCDCLVPRPHLRTRKLIPPRLDRAR